MMASRFRVCALFVLVLFSLVAPAAVSASGAAVDWTYRPLKAADFTNGVVKSKFVTGSFQDMCSATWDISLIIYYDQLDANHIHLTKVTTKYYILRGTPRVGGGVGRIDWNGAAFWEGADAGNDLWTMYHFKPAVQDAEHYSLSGTYTVNIDQTYDNRGFTVSKYTYGSGGWNEDCLGLTQGEWYWA